MGRSVQGQKWKWFGEESVDTRTRTARCSPNFRSFAMWTWGMSSSRGPSKCPDPVDVEQAAEVKWRRGEDMRGAEGGGATDQEGLPAFLSLSPREEKSKSVRSGGGRGRGGKEEERGEGWTPIQGSTRPVGMECRYKSSSRPHPCLLASWPVPSFRPSHFSFFPSPIRHFFFYVSLRHSPPTAMLLTESSPCSTSLPASPFTTTLLCVPVELPLRAATALLYYYYYHHCFRLLLLLPLLLLLLQLSLRVHDLVTVCERSLFILLLTSINLDYYVSIWIMLP